MGYQDGIDEVADHAYRGIGVDNPQQPALLQCIAITEMGRKGLKTARLQPFGIVVGLIDDMIGCLGEGLVGIVRHDQEPKAAREADAVRGAVLLRQLGDIPIVDFPVRSRHGEAIAETDRAAAAVKPPSQIGGYGFWMGSGVTRTFWKSKNSLLKVTVSPRRARRRISSDWSVRAPRCFEDTPIRQTPPV